MRRILAAVLALVLVLALGACAPAEGTSSGASGSTGSSQGGTERINVKVGIVGDLVEPWEEVDRLLEDEGIDIEIVKFSDYPVVNQALADGSLDLNAFQHYAYFESDAGAKGLDLTPIGNTIIGPLSVYSQKIKSLDELKEGDIIAIPNDPTNGGRALKVLETAGVIKVDPEAGYSPTVTDITENPLDIEFKEVDSGMLVSLLPDVAAAVINSNHAFDNGLDPLRDSIYAQPVDDAGADNPYTNIIVARTEDKDNEVYKRIVEAYQTDEVAKVLLDTYKGVYIPTWEYTYEE